MRAGRVRYDSIFEEKDKRIKKTQINANVYVVRLRRTAHKRLLTLFACISVHLRFLFL